MAEVAEASPAARTAGGPPADRSGLRLGLFVGGLWWLVELAWQPDGNLPPALVARRSILGA